MFVSGLVNCGNVRLANMAVLEITAATTLGSYVLALSMAIVTKAPYITEHIDCTCYQERR